MNFGAKIYTIVDLKESYTNSIFDKKYWKKNKKIRKYNFFSVNLVLLYFLVSLPVSYSVSTLNSDNANLAIGEMFFIPVLEGVQSDCKNSTTSITINVPSGNVGDLLIALIGTDDDENINTPSGWTSILVANAGISGPTLAVFYRVTDGSEPSTYTFDGWGTEGVCAAIMRYSNVDITNPINAFAFASDSNNSDAQCPSTTTTVNNAIIVRIVALDDNEAPISQPGGTIKQLDIESSTSTLAAADASQATAGSTGSAQWFHSDEQWMAATLVLIPIVCSAAAVASGNSPICAGEDINLTESGGDSTSWSWSGPNSFTSTYQNPTISSTNTASNGTYTVTITDSNGCTATDAVTITVNASPTANAGTDAAICIGSSTNLSASGGISYSWSPSTGLNATNVSNPTASPTTTTTYTVTVTDANGCTNTDDVIVTVNSLPIAETGTNITICSGSSVNLYVSGGYSYSWSPSTGLNATNVFNPIANPTSTTTYTVTVTGFNGCTATDQLTVNVSSLITANAGADTSICHGSSTSLITSGGTSYAWSPSTGLSATNVPNPTASPTTITTYVVTVTDSNGCTNTDDVIVNVNSLPNANAGNDVSICVGSSIGLSASGGTSYSWSPSIGLSSTTVSNPSANPSASTAYTVTVTDASGCTDTDDVLVTVNSVAAANAGIDVSICVGSSINMQASGGISYTWGPSTGLSATNVSNPSANPTTTTTYIVTVTDAIGLYRYR